MATSNTQLTKTWAKVADSSDDPVMVTYRGPAFVEVALTAANVAPTVTRGHLLRPRDVVTREVVGDGYMWMRCVPDGPVDSALIEVSK